MIADMANTNTETVRKKSVFRNGPENLNQDQKDNRKNISSDINERLTEETVLLKNVISCDKTGIFRHDRETMRQLIHFTRWYDDWMGTIEKS